jgi:trimethylguanosine synthase
MKSKRQKVQWQVAGGLPLSFLVCRWSKEAERKNTEAAGSQNIDAVGAKTALQQPISPQDALAYHDSLVRADPALQRYYRQRYSLFTRFDSGILLDHESWYSVTPEAIAQHHARKFLYHVLVSHPDTSLTPDTMSLYFPGDSFWFIDEETIVKVLKEKATISLNKFVILDGFCGAGGNAIQFSRLFQHVIGIDQDAQKLYLARQNSSIYQIPPTILQLFHGNSLKILPHICQQLLSFSYVPCVFLSPPWGGPSYRHLPHAHPHQKNSFPLENLLDGVGLAGLLSMLIPFTSTIAVFLPRNTNRQAIINTAKAVGLKSAVTIEENFLDHRCKAITVYFGILATPAANKNSQV